MKTMNNIESGADKNVCPIRDAKIINIKDYADYVNKLSEIMEKATNFGNEIIRDMFKLACMDKWKKWSDDQPLGTKLYVDDDMLRNTGDKNIDLLWEILDKIMDVKHSFIKKL